LYPSL
jgi:carbamoyl-phosphate synthase small subunit